MLSIAAEGLDETGLPAEAYVPTATGAQQPVHAAFPGSGQTVGGAGSTGSGQGNQTVFDAGTH